MNEHEHVTLFIIIFEFKREFSKNISLIKIILKIFLFKKIMKMRRLNEF